MADDTPRVQPDPAVLDYAVAHGNPPDAVLLDLIAETRERFADRSGMQVDPAQGAFLELLTRIVRPSFAVEVGTFTGYSSICIARGLPPEGRLVCCDISEEYTDVARRYWARAGVEDRIELRLGPAAPTLSGLVGDPPVDLAFVDADKTGYHGYLEALLRVVRPGGVIVIDNVLWNGRILDEADTSPDTTAIRAFNVALAEDARVDVAMLTIGDGLTVARVRESPTSTP